MAIKQIEQQYNTILDSTRKKFIMDDTSDFANLPKCCPGSSAFSVDGGTVYMVNASGEWTETTSAAIPFAEGVGF